MTKNKIPWKKPFPSFSKYVYQKRLIHKFWVWVKRLCLNTKF